ncbi:hypothetical protein V8E52_011664 [Russula decolorans]
MALHKPKGHLYAILLPSHLPINPRTSLPKHSHAAPPDNQLKAELSKIKSTISMLSKVVNSLPPKAKGTTPASQSPPPKGKPSTQGQGSGNVTPPTFTSKATAQSRPSLILDLRFLITKWQSTTDIVTFVNDRLYTQRHQHVKLSTAKWTSKGNLVFTAHHTVTQAQLTDASHTILTLLQEEYPNTFTLTTELTAWANVKWSKILINSIPTESHSSTPATTRAPVGPSSSVPASSVRPSTQQPNTPRPQCTTRSQKIKD